MKDPKLDKIKCQFCNVIAYSKLACKTVTKSVQSTSSKLVNQQLPPLKEKIKQEKKDKQFK